MKGDVRVPYTNYEDVKEYVHKRGVTIKLISSVMRISPNTFRHRYNGDVSSEDWDNLEYCLEKAQMALRYHNLITFFVKATNN